MSVGLLELLSPGAICVVSRREAPLEPITTTAFVSVALLVVVFASMERRERAATPKNADENKWGAPSRVRFCSLACPSTTLENSSLVVWLHFVAHSLEP